MIAIHLTNIMYLVVEFLILAVYLHPVTAITTEDYRELKVENLEEITTELECEGKEMYLTCPKEFVIEVVRAMYGKTDERYCYDGKQMCDCEADRNATLAIVQRKCNDIQRCRFVPNSNLFGDPCEGYRKYLHVTFKCKEISGIKSKYVCENQTLELDCPNGKLKIVKAFYGRSAKPYCLDETKNTSSTSCENPEAIYLMQYNCNGRSNCKVDANSDVFGNDTCVDIFKFLEVNYLCEEEKILNDYSPSLNVSESQRICEDKAMLLSCPPENYINIKSAFYGQKEDGDCYKGKKTIPHCEATEGLEKVKEWCDQKEDCVILATNEYFSDPCPNITKYLEVSYDCTQNKLRKISCEFDNVTLSCPRGRVIVITSVLYGRTSDLYCRKFGLPSINCEFKKAHTYVNSKCHLRKYCILNSKVGEFSDDICQGTTKYFDVTYMCEKSEKYGIAKTLRVCESSTLQMVCPAELLIRTTYAMYGRLEATACFNASSSQSSYHCSSPDATIQVSRRCDKAVNCSITADNTIFGDPCVNSSKYLDVDYLCVKKFIGEDQSSLACEGNKLNIKCEQGYYLWIESAFYGREQKYTCFKKGLVSNTNCAAQTPLTVMQSSCNNLANCSVYASSTIFGDPCPGTHKYLEVEYQCLPISGEKKSSVACEHDKLNIIGNHGYYLWIVNPLYGRKQKSRKV